MEYCNRLKEKNITLHKKVVIIDGVHSGTGILVLESALNHFYPGLDVTKIAINADIGIAKIPVDKEIILPCEPINFQMFIQDLLLLFIQDILVFPPKTDLCCPL